MKGFLSNLVVTVIACVLLYAVGWTVVEATSSLKQAKAEVKKAEDRRDLAQLRLKDFLSESREREVWSGRFFIIAVNLGEDLDALQLCIEFAWDVCEDDGEIVCGIDVRGDCSFTCCPEEVRGE